MQTQLKRQTKLNTYLKKNIKSIERENNRIPLQMRRTISTKIQEKEQHQKEC